MKNACLRLLAGALVLASAACSHKERTPSGTASANAAATMTPIPASVRVAEFVTFGFTDVAVTSSGARVLRLGFDVKNGSKDPLLCDESGFSAQLADGSVLSPDAGAQNTCDPDSIDPGSTAKAVMFFDLPDNYTGPITVLMKSADNTLVGQGTTTIR